MFVDEVVVTLIAGNGGDGCMAFRREKYVPMGGPFGGNGGKGGDIIFKVNEGLRTLIDLRYQKKIKAQSGSNGQGKNKNGKNAQDTIISVPIGSTIKDYDTGVVIADLTKKEEEVIVAYGGRGGRGNVTLATKSNPCPSYCENGEPGEERKIIVELRMLADVGLVGLPSVGKSTILSMITNANPKIASYHFTTLSPNLGVVKTKDYDFTVADLPGLIEGASSGLGLGHKFLKHIERTKVIAHIIDMNGTEGRDPYDDFIKINKELESFNKKLVKKPMIVIANKMDMPNAEDNLKKFKKKVKCEIYPISAINSIGIDKVLIKLANLVESSNETPLYEEGEYLSHVLYKFEKTKPFTIEKKDDYYIIHGDEIERLFRMTTFSSDEAVLRFAKKLRKLGIDDELEKLGAKEGDIVKILDFDFQYRK